jgi:membrane protease YdiL (CAAX protease family)
MSISPRILLLALLVTLLATATATATTSSFAAAATARPLAQVPAPVPAPTPTTPAPATKPAQELSTPTTIAFGLVLLALAFVGLALAGVSRGGSIRGPQRLPPGSPVLPILIVFLIGATCWFGGQAVIFGVLDYRYAATHGGERLSLDKIDAWDLAILATVPALAAMLVMLAGDMIFRLLRPIGLRLSHLPRMLFVGIAAGVVSLLLVYGSSSLLQVFYEWVRYEHPSEHELLGAMKEASATAQVMLVIGACAVAPLFEELLFRGHMQTLLTRLFLGARAPCAGCAGGSGGRGAVRT